MLGSFGIACFEPVEGVCSAALSEALSSPGPGFDRARAHLALPRAGASAWQRQNAGPWLGTSPRGVLWEATSAATAGRSRRGRRQVAEPSVEPGARDDGPPAFACTLAYRAAADLPETRREPGADDRAGVHDQRHPQHRALGWTGRAGSQCVEARSAGTVRADDPRPGCWPGHRVRDRLRARSARTCQAAHPNPSAGTRRSWRLAAHADSAVAVIAMVFAAEVFTGGSRLPG